MDTPYTWTVDVDGGDYGGRTNGIQGIKEGLPIILEIFRAYKIKALFFISSEIAIDNRGSIQRIIEHGHEIGSHGHFHIRYKDEWRALQDKKISELLLETFKSSSQKTLRYRAPWFNFKVSGELYSHRKGHVSILKQTWFGGRLPNDPIFYIHPFDIVRGSNFPNIFTRVLYSNPDRVLDTFKRLCLLYPGKGLE